MAIRSRPACPLRAGLLLACLLLATGCGGGAASVNGTVKWQGKPLAEGGIIFLPQDADKKIVNGPVRDGAFSFSATDGLQPGKYKVRISWLRKTGKKVPNVDLELVTDETVEMIPRQYNQDTKLEADLKSGGNKLEFDLK